MRRALVCFFCMISLFLQTAPTAEIALQSSRKLPAKKSAFSFSWKKAVIITIPLLLYWKWKAIRSFFEEAVESSVHTAPAVEPAVVPNELPVPEDDADCGVDIDRVVSTLAPRLNPAAIKKMLENDLSSPKQTGMTCGAYAIANVLTAFGYSVTGKPLDPNKSFLENAKYNAEVIIRLMQKQTKKDLADAEKDLARRLQAKEDLDKFLEKYRSSEDKNLSDLLIFLEGPGAIFNPLSCNADRQLAYNALALLTTDAAALERFKVTFILEAIQDHILPSFTQSITQCHTRIRNLQQALNGSLDPSEETYIKAIADYNPALMEAAPLSIFTEEGLKSKSISLPNSPPDAISFSLGMALTYGEQGHVVPAALLPEGLSLEALVSSTHQKISSDFESDIPAITAIINSQGFKNAYAERVGKLVPDGDFKNILLSQKQTPFSTSDAKKLFQANANLIYSNMPDADRQAYFQQKAQHFASGDDTIKTQIIDEVVTALSLEGCARHLHHKRVEAIARKTTPLGLHNPATRQALLDIKNGQPGAFVIRKPDHYVAAVVKDGDIVLLDSNSGTGRNSLDPTVEANLKNYFFAPGTQS